MLAGFPASCSRQAGSVRMPATGLTGSLTGTLTKLAPLYCEVKAISPGLRELCNRVRRGVLHRRAGSFRQKRETQGDGNYLQTSTIEVPLFNHNGHKEDAMVTMYFFENFV